VVAKDLVIETASAGGSGGAFRAGNWGRITGSGWQTSDTTAAANGGLVAFDDDAFLDLGSSVITNPRATAGNGGASRAGNWGRTTHEETPDVSMQNVVVRSSQAGGDGGFFRAGNWGHVVATGLTIEVATAGGSGGVFRAGNWGRVIGTGWQTADTAAAFGALLHMEDDVDFSLERSTIIRPRTQSGSGIVAKFGDWTQAAREGDERQVRFVGITMDDVEGAGSALVFGTGGDITVSGSLMSGAENGNAAGIHMDGGSLNVVESMFEDIGPLYFQGDGSSIFSHSTVSGGVGINFISVNGGQSDWSNCLLFGQDTDGPLVSNTAATGIQFSSCTFANADFEDVLFDVSGSLAVTNSVLASGGVLFQGEGDWAVSFTMGLSLTSSGNVDQAQPLASALAWRMTARVSMRATPAPCHRTPAMWMAMGIAAKSSKQTFWAGRGCRALVSIWAQSSQVAHGSRPYSPLVPSRFVKAHLLRSACCPQTQPQLVVSSGM
jgi:hypothetical protein